MQGRASMLCSMQFPSPFKKPLPDPYDAGEREQQKSILSFLRMRGVSSSTEIVQGTGLSRSTVIRIADTLCNKGLVINLGMTTFGEKKTGGKPPFRYEFNSSSSWLVSASIKHGSLDLAITDGFSRIRTYEHEDLVPDEALESIAGRITRFVDIAKQTHPFRRTEPLGLTIATQGLVDPTTGIVREVIRFPSWGYNAPVAGIITSRLERDMPVRVESILRMATLAELRKGRGKGLSSMVHVYAGPEGLGAGIVSNGMILSGTNGMAGEIGHMVINPQETEPCGCGRKGCFEQQVDPARFVARNGIRDLHGFFKSYRDGVPEAVSKMDDVAKWMAIGLLNVRLMIDPAIITLAGIYREASDRFIDHIYKEASRYGLNELGPCPKILFSETGESGALVGSSLRLIEEYLQLD